MTIPQVERRLRFLFDILHYLESDRNFQEAVLRVVRVPSYSFTTTTTTTITTPGTDIASWGGVMHGVVGHVMSHVIIGGGVCGPPGGGRQHH